MRTAITVVLGLLLAPPAAHGWGFPAAPHAPETTGVEWAQRTCDAVMKRSPVLTDRWHYDVGLVLSGFESVWRRTGARTGRPYSRPWSAARWPPGARML